MTFCYYNVMNNPTHVLDGDRWVRHSNDIPLGGQGTEYAGYTTYNPLVPVGRPDIAEFTSPSSDVMPGTDMVLCISCHRAHGSPYPKMLRWDLSGCKTCHTSK